MKDESLKVRIIHRLHEEMKQMEDTFAITQHTTSFDYYIAIIHSLRDLRNL